MLKSENRVGATNDVILAMIGELSELMDGYKALPWKPEREDREYILEEIIDLQHFVLELLLIWGVTTDTEIEERYFKKKTKNLNERGKIHITHSNDLSRRPRNPWVDLKGVK